MNQLDWSLRAGTPCEPQNGRRSWVTATCDPTVESQFLCGRARVMNAELSDYGVDANSYPSSVYELGMERQPEHGAFDRAPPRPSNRDRGEATE